MARTRRAHDRERSAPGGAGTAPPEVWDRLAGYRLLRTLGDGERSVTYLASGDDGQVVVKAYRESVESNRIRDEATCLAAIDSPHVVRLLDVSATSGRPTCLVLERLGGPSLADWLARNAGIETGEAVTIAVSVARAARAVHLAGWAHGRIAATRIRFDESGRPTLLGFGGAAAATPVANEGDWAACCTIIDTVLHRVREPDPDAVDHVTEAARRLTTAAAQSDEVTALAELEDALFALGPPGPVSMRMDAAPTATSLPLRLAPGPTADDRTRRETVPVPVPLTTPRSSPIALRLFRALASLSETGVTTALRSRLRAITARHTRAVAVGIGVAVAVTLAVLLTMPRTPAGHAEPTEVPRGGQVAARPTAPHARASMPAATSPTTTLSGSGNPVDATFALLRARHECLQRRSVSCLTDIDQPGSPISAADAAAVEAGRSPADVPESSRLSLTESLGDAAVISVAPSTRTTKPASILVIRTEAGWRLRSVFEG